MSTVNSSSLLDDYDDKDSIRSTDKLFIVSQVIILLLAITLSVVILLFTIPHKPIYYNKVIENYSFELNSEMSWQKSGLYNECETYTGVSNGNTVCVVRIYRLNDYNSTEDLINELHDFYSNSESYSGLSSVFKNEGYLSFNSIFMDGQNSQIRVYDNNSYISINWVGGLELDEFIGNIAKVED